MSSVLDTASAGVLGVAAPFAAVFARIEHWRTLLEPLLVGLPDHAVDVPDVARLDAAVADVVVPDLEHQRDLIVGAGFVAAPRFVPGAEWHLAWWLGAANTFGALPGNVTRRLAVISDPHADGFRDYTHLEWWRVPAATRRPHLTGPYVDYLCTDEYTLTLTVPVEKNGEVIGVLGADLYVADIERSVLPALHTLGSPASLVNRSGRVIASTDPHRAAGSIFRGEGLRDSLRDLDAGGSARVIPVPWGGASLALVV
jgi:hypothetical protein